MESTRSWAVWFCRKLWRRWRNCREFSFTRKPLCHTESKARLMSRKVAITQFPVFSSVLSWKCTWSSWVWMECFGRNPCWGVEGCFRLRSRRCVVRLSSQGIYRVWSGGRLVDKIQSFLGVFLVFLAAIYWVGKNPMCRHAFWIQMFENYSVNTVWASSVQNGWYVCWLFYWDMRIGKIGWLTNCSPVESWSVVL